MHLNRYKDILRKLFYSVDKLYTLSELVNSNGNQNKEFMKNFFKLINALSESVIFSQSLSNHLTEGMIIFYNYKLPRQCSSKAFQQCSKDCHSKQISRTHKDSKSH